METLFIAIIAASVIWFFLLLASEGSDSAWWTIFNVGGPVILLAALGLCLWGLVEILI